MEKSYIVAIDTANEVIALGIGSLLPEEKRIVTVASKRVKAHRASNTLLLPTLDKLCADLGINRSDISCVACGRGPGSFTGVRIAMATAKGIAQALGVGLIGISTLDAIAFGAHEAGVRGEVIVVADAMRKEVYPVRFHIDDAGIRRLDADRVVKAQIAADELAETANNLQITGDALTKYLELFEPHGTILPQELWTADGNGLLRVVEAVWRDGRVDPLDGIRHLPALALPVYTRLSDAEENERARLAKTDPRDLGTGVQGAQPRSTDDCCTSASSNETRNRVAQITLFPLDGESVPSIAALEQQLMGSDAWSVNSVSSELNQRNRTWWMAKEKTLADNLPTASTDTAAEDEALETDRLVGYAGGMLADGDLQILKIAVDQPYQRQGIARSLLGRVAQDGRNLGAETCSLEVRVSNEIAQAFYRSVGFTEQGKRPGYYSDREDALIMAAPIQDIIIACETNRSTTGKTDHAPREITHPLILAIESSCDETAASVIDGNGTILSDVVASQIDFHARFGGVVPEIASRKHIEAICGVVQEALDIAAEQLGLSQLPMHALDAISATYAPGLVGALVVGVAYAKGAAWGANKPYIGVNHLEGHLFANKMALPDMQPPAIVSLVSGGNTLLVHVKDWGHYETLGSTIDDAVGEAFDKVAKALGLPYPGGPVISKLAAQGDPNSIPFPRAMLHSGDLRFSLSGLKTAVITYLNQERAAGRPWNLPNIAASFQQAVIDVQVAKAKAALGKTGAPIFCLGGGVAANPALRSAYEKMCESLGVQLVLPPLRSCGDNAAMIALVALDRYAQGKFFPLSLDAYAHTNLDDPY